MISHIRLLALSVFLAVLPAAANADDGAENNYLSCSRLIEESARLACYDSVSRGQAARTAAETEAKPPSAAPLEVEPEPVPAAVGQKHEEDRSDDAADAERFVPLTDDVGASDLGRGKLEEIRAIRAHVAECRVGASGRYYFYFDNGQVWKQVDKIRQDLEACDYSVTIEKDTFGYKMKPDANVRAVRIKRVK